MKMGHGGTLDPMATGVLIVGVGNGTKSLQGFLDGTKTYEAVVVFGAATDTYDYEGKIVKRAPYHHITKAAFEEALGKFRGDIMQRPPIFSALRVQGKRLYEYARKGKEAPVEIQERPVTVSELECVEWLEPGTHKYNFPTREAEQEDKKVADKMLNLDAPVEEGEAEVQDQALKRKREEDADDTAAVHPTTLPKRAKQEEEPATPTTEATEPASAGTAQEQAIPEVIPATETEPLQELKPCPAPAARIRMTVSSGFYVRSLCHDLGAELKSLAFMASLARTRQSEFELGKNVLEYDELALGEDVWGPKVTSMLEQWDINHPNGYERQSQPAKRQHGSASHKSEEQRQRNSSSPEA